MSDRIKDMQGTVVSEEEVAKNLGFADVHELRRWQTDLGHKVMELEHALHTTKDDLRNFKWHGERMLRIFDRIEVFLVDLQKGQTPDQKLIEKLLLGVRVVCGHGVDWNHELKDWLGELSI